MHSRLPAFAVVLLALACGEPTRPGVNRDQSLVILTASQTIQVPRTLDVLARGGGNATIGWRSSDETIASVSALGYVTAKFPGDVIITAFTASQSAALNLTVTAARVDIVPSPASVAVNGTSPLAAIVRDADGATLDGLAVAWSAANTSIASVSASSGVVTGISNGSTMVTATAGGARGAVTVIVGTGTPDNPFARLAFSSLSTVGNYTCGLEARTGFAYCWGDNHSGALGIGEVAGSDTPVRVTGGLRFRSLSVGYYGNCAIEAESGLAYCWGRNQSGNLGDGTLTTRWVPTLVESGGERFSSISTSGELTCGVDAETRLGYCWGSEGGIGDGTLTQRNVPTLVGTAGDRIHFSSISVGGHACGVEAETGRAYCWGPNESGQLGDGTTVERLLPTLVAGGELRFSSISPGDAFTCGIEARTGVAYCWGANSIGQLADGTSITRSAPKPIAGIAPRFTAISSRGDLACGIEAETGIAYCWGRGYSGSARTLPTMVSGDPIRFSSINVGGDGCGVEAETGRGYCWGSTLVPTPLVPLSSVTSASRR